MSSTSKNEHSTDDDSNATKPITEPASSEYRSQRELLKVLNETAETLQCFVQNVTNRTEIEAGSASANHSRTIQYRAANGEIQNEDFDHSTGSIEGDNVCAFSNNMDMQLDSQSVYQQEDNAAKDYKEMIKDINTIIEDVCYKSEPPKAQFDASLAKSKVGSRTDEEKPIIDVSNPFLINPTNSFITAHTKDSVTAAEEDKLNVNKSFKAFSNNVTNTLPAEGELLKEESETNQDLFVHSVEFLPETYSLSEQISDAVCNVLEISKTESIVKKHRATMSSVKEAGFVEPNGKVMNPLMPTTSQHFATCSKTEKLTNILNAGNQCGSIEPTASTLENEILLRGEMNDKRTKILQLPSETMPYSPSRCEKEIVGDDAAKTAVDILCECGQPSMTGGAVPVVTSFNVADAKTQKNDVPKFKTEILPNNSKKDLERNKARPSLIPKLSSTFRNEKVHSLTRTGKNNCLISPPQDEAKSRKPLRNICFSSPEERVKQGTPFGKTSNRSPKIDSDEQMQHEEQSLLNLQHEATNKQKRYKKLSSEFSKYVSRLAEEASALPNIKDPDVQMTAVDDLYKRITILKKIANDLKTMNNRVGSESIILDRAPNLDGFQKGTESSYSNNKSKNKDNNRIHIKFLPAKYMAKKRKSPNSVQAKPDEMIVKSPDQETLKKPLSEDIEAKEVDSMDGMFIPSFDEPPKIEEDEDEDGLDITITFPELQKAFNQEDSHLSVRFSSISAEALGHLKRCPKEFTLRMDFIQGRMFFQSGKSPANNYAIGPDLKITECTLDSKQSDIISIKPSTECVYTSQIIPVEGATRKDSLKILKSTDSELFKVVGLPYVHKKSSAATKSCITFKNLRRVASDSSLADKTVCKSMPQIPSLIRILEEPDLESVVSGIRTVMINAEKKPRNRMLQKKRNNTSTNNILLYDVP